MFYHFLVSTIVAIATCSPGVAASFDPSTPYIKDSNYTGLARFSRAFFTDTHSGQLGRGVIFGKESFSESFVESNSGKISSSGRYFDHVTAVYKNEVHSGGFFVRNKLHSKGFVVDSHIEFIGNSVYSRENSATIVFRFEQEKMSHGDLAKTLRAFSRTTGLLDIDFADNNTLATLRSSLSGPIRGLWKQFIFKRSENEKRPTSAVILITIDLEPQDIRALMTTISRPSQVRMEIEAQIASYLRRGDADGLCMGTLSSCEERLRSESYEAMLSAHYSLAKAYRNSTDHSTSAPALAEFGKAIMTNQFVLATYLEQPGVGPYGEIRMFDF